MQNAETRAEECLGQCFLPWGFRSARETWQLFWNVREVSPFSENLPDDLVELASRTKACHWFTTSKWTKYYYSFKAVPQNETSNRRVTATKLIVVILYCSIMFINATFGPGWIFATPSGAHYKHTVFCIGKHNRLCFSIHLATAKPYNARGVNMT